MVCNKKKTVFIKRKWNHVVFSRTTILSFHPVIVLLDFKVTMMSQSIMLVTTSQKLPQFLYRYVFFMHIFADFLYFLSFFLSYFQTATQAKIFLFMHIFADFLYFLLFFSFLFSDCDSSQELPFQVFPETSSAKFLYIFDATQLRKQLSEKAERSNTVSSNQEMDLNMAGQVQKLKVTCLLSS